MVYYLQNYPGGWEHGEFREKMEIAENCNRPPPYHLDSETNHYTGPFWLYSMTSKDLKCLNFQGTTRIMAEFIEEKALNYKSFMLDRAENMLHDYFGDAEYWSARRSMRFSAKLVQISAKFRASELDSNDEKDLTMLEESWEKYRPTRGLAKGGPYLCAHVRRKDFTFSRKDQIPDLKSAAEQIWKKCEEFKLTKVYIATDAPETEYLELEKLLSEYGLQVSYF